MTNLDKLKNLLAELFMLDQADLDFGIYRVMNAKRAEVTRFLDHDLLPQVRAELEKSSTPATAPGWKRNWPKPLPPRSAAGFSRRAGRAIAQGRRPSRPACRHCGRFRARKRSSVRSCQFLPPLLFRRRFSCVAPLQGRRLCHSLRRRGSEAPLGQRRPILHQDQRISARLHVQAGRRQAGSFQARRSRHRGGQQKIRRRAGTPIHPVRRRSAGGNRRRTRHPV